MTMKRTCIATFLALLIVGAQHLAFAESEGEPPEVNYAYRAMVTRVVDGDTVDALIDVGFRILTEQRLRLARIDTPELRGGTAESKAKAREARDYVRKVLGPFVDVVVQTSKADSFGRYLTEVWYKTAEGKWVNLSDELLSKGLAKKYDK